MQQMNNLIVIAAAGLGKRMKMSGPKAAIKISDSETVIERQIRLFKKFFPSYKIVVVIGSAKEKMEKILNNKVEIIINNDFDSSNTAWSIKQAIEKENISNLILCCGDLVFNESMISKIITDFSCVVLDINNIDRSSEVGCNITNCKLNHINYGLNPKWSQIAFLKKEEINILQKILKKSKVKNWFFFELMNKIIDMGGSFFTHIPTNGYMVEIDSQQDIKKAKIFAQTFKD